MSLNIIAFSGRRGSGKTTAANHLVRNYGFKAVSFGSALKDIARSFFPFTPVDFSESRKEKPYGKHEWSPRDFMIALGKLGRYFDEDFWVNASGIDRLSGNIVVDDMRFPNEVRYLQGLGARLVRINRYENLNVYGKNLDDSTESALDKFDKFDYTIHECRNIKIADLHHEIEVMLKEFGLGKRGS